MTMINLESGTGFSSAVLIADLVQSPNGSVDSTAEFTKVGGPFGQTASVALEIQSILGGVLLPRMTTTQMNALTPVNGMLIYNTTVSAGAGAFYGYVGGAWVEIAFLGPDIGLTAGPNIVLTPNPILASGIVGLSTTLTSLISVQVGNMTLSSSTIQSTGSLNLATNNGINAISIDTSQNSSFFGYIRINNNAGLIFDNVGNTQATTILAGAIASNFTITLPATLPTINNNQALTATTAGVTQWTTVAVQGGNALATNLSLGTNDANSLILKTNGTTALTINTSQNTTLAGNITVQGGTATIGTPSQTGKLVLDSSAGGSISQQAPSIAGNYTYTWPTAYPVASGYILVSDTSGNLSWIFNEETSGTANTLAYFNSGGLLASNTNVTVHSGGDITTTSTLQAGNITLNTNNINANGSLILATGGSTTAITIDASQNSAFSGYIRINSNAGLILDNAGNTQATTLVAGAIASTFTITLPAAQPTISNNQALTATTAGVTQWTTVAVNGGNTLGAALTLGTTDANSLILKTNGTTALSIDSSQNTTSSGNITLANSGGNSSYSLIFNNGTANNASIQYNQFLTNENLTLTSKNIVLAIDQGGGSGDCEIQHVGVGTITTLDDGSGNMTVGGTLTAKGASITSGVASSQTGSLILASAGGGTLTQKVPGGGVTTYSITWPSAAAASNGYILSSDTSGNLSWIPNEDTSGSANTLAYYNNTGLLVSNTNVTVHSGGDITTTSTLQAGNIILNTNDINASGGSLTLSSASTTAITLSSATATFSGDVNLLNSHILTLGANPLIGSTFTPVIALNYNSIKNLQTTISSSDATILSTGVDLVLGASTGNIILNNSAYVAATLYLEGASGQVGFKASGAVTSYTMTYPTAAPSNAGFLNVANSGSTNWVTGRCSFQSSALQTIANNSIVAVNFATTNFNFGSIITESTNNTFTNTSGSTVYVFISYNIYWDFINFYPNNVESWISINGGSYQHALSSTDFTMSADPHTTTGNFIIALANNDSFQVLVSQISGGNAAISDNGGGQQSELYIWQLA